MSPITHGIFGWLVSQPLASKKDRAMVTGFALIPDVDGLSLLFGVEAYGEFHHTIGHGLMFGLITSLAIFANASEKRLALLLGLLSFHSHLLGDLLGSGVGWTIPYFWPSTVLTLELPPSMTWNLDSWQNLVATIAGLIGVYVIAIKRGRTFVEIVSTSADQKIVATLRRWNKEVKIRLKK